MTAETIAVMEEEAAGEQTGVEVETEAEVEIEIEIAIEDGGEAAEAEAARRM